MRCIEFGNLDDLRSKHAGETLTAKIAILPSPDLTAPSLLINPKSVAFNQDYQYKEI